MSLMNNHKQGGKMSTQAFTLVEVVVATALLITTLALFLGTFVSAKRSAVIADNRMEAIQNARSNMEILVSSTYLSTYLSTGAHPSAVTVTSTPISISYSVVVTQTPPGIVVKNVYLTNRWINPGTKMTSTVSLVGSVSPQLHP